MTHLLHDCLLLFYIKRAIFKRLSITLLLLTSCSYPTPSRVIDQVHSHEGVLKSSSQYPHYLSLSLEGFSSCDEKLLSALEPKDSSTRPLITLDYSIHSEDLEHPASGVNLKQILKRIEQGQHGLSLRLNDSLTRKIEHANEARDQLLYEAHEHLSRQLHALGWQRLRPLPKLWRPTHFVSGVEPKSFVAQEWLAYDWSQEFKVQDQQQIQQVMPTLLDAVVKEGGVIRIPKKVRCALIPQLKTIQKHLKNKRLTTVTLEELFAQQLSEIEHPRLVRINRAPVSEGCAQLLGIEQELENQNRPRWSLILTQVYTHERHYLALPVPHLHRESIPNWTDTPALSALWKRRHLWWGATHCLHMISESDIMSPFPSIQASAYSDLTHLQQLNMPKSLHFQKPYGVSHLPLLYQTNALERSKQVPLKWRGIFTELWPNRSALNEIDRLFGFAIYYSGDPIKIKAVTMISARPLKAYRLLAHLTGSQALAEIAYQNLSFAGPILMLPSQTGWRTTQQLKIGQQSFSLDNKELPKLKQAGWIIHGIFPPLFPFTITDIHSVYGGRGRLKRALKLEDQQGHTMRSGEIWHLDGGRLGTQRIRLISSSQRKQMSEELSR